MGLLSSQADFTLKIVVSPSWLPFAAQIDSTADADVCTFQKAETGAHRWIDGSFQPSKWQERFTHVAEALYRARSRWTVYDC
jgi:hypothetical protein